MATVAARMYEADQLMRNGLGVTVIVDIGADTIQIKDPLCAAPAGQPLGAKILDPAVTHTNLDVNIIACDSPASEVAEGAVMNIPVGRQWGTVAGGAGYTAYLNT